MGLFDRFKKEKAPAAVSFRMETNFRGNIPNCTLADVKKHIRECLEGDEFLVLVPEAPVENTKFLQMAAGAGEITVECSVGRGDGTWALLEKTFGSRELNQVEALFAAYFQGKAPDTAGWEDTGIT